MTGGLRARRGVQVWHMGETWAVIPTRDRENLLYRCLDAVGPQVDGVVVINNADEPLDLGGNVDVINRPEWPPNLSAMWNRGLDHVADHVVSPEWNVAVVNDDCEVPADWAESLATALVETGAALAYTDRLGRPERVLYTSPLTTPHESMTGWAFMLRGGLGYRFDETLRWWWGDSAADAWARRHGGTVAAPGQHPVHHCPNGHTVAHPELTEQASRDRLRFAEVWGSAPW